MGSVPTSITTNQAILATNWQIATGSWTFVIFDVLSFVFLFSTIMLNSLLANSLNTAARDADIFYILWKGEKLPAIANVLFVLGSWCLIVVMCTSFSGWTWTLLKGLNNSGVIMAWVPGLLMTLVCVIGMQLFNRFYILRWGHVLYGELWAKRGHHNMLSNALESYRQAAAVDRETYLGEVVYVDQANKSGSDIIAQFVRNEEIVNNGKRNL